MAEDLAVRLTGDPWDQITHFYLSPILHFSILTPFSQFRHIGDLPSTSLKSKTDGNQKWKGLPLHSDDELEQLLERRKSNNYLSRIFTRKHYLDTQQCKTLLSYWSDVNCFKSAGVQG